MIRPGPPRIRAGRAPGGYVVHVYSVPAGELVSVAAITPETDLYAVAEAQAAASAGAGTVCVVFFDGDTGEREVPPGMESGERL